MFTDEVTQRVATNLGEAYEKEFNAETNQKMLEKADKFLTASMKEQISAAAQQEINDRCDYAKQRALLEDLVKKEREAIVAGLEEQTAVTEQLSGEFSTSMSANSVYSGTYENREDQKEDAKQALSFAKKCVEAKQQVAGTYAKYAMVSMQRMATPSTWKKPDTALKGYVQIKAESVVHNTKRKGKALYLLPILLGIVFIFVPMMLRGVLSEAVDDWFYSTVESDVPNVVGCSVGIAVVGIALIWILRSRQKATALRCARWYAMSLGLIEKAEQDYTELSAYYDAESKKLKERSDSYFNLSDQLMGNLINDLLLAPFPADFMNVDYLNAGIMLLDTGKANSLAEVFAVLRKVKEEIERVNAAQKQAEAQRLERQRLEKERLARERLEAQRKQEEIAKQKALEEKAHADEPKEEPKRLVLVGRGWSEYYEIDGKYIREGLGTPYGRYTGYELHGREIWYEKNGMMKTMAVISVDGSNGSVLYSDDYEGEKIFERYEWK